MSAQKHALMSARKHALMSARKHALMSAQKHALMSARKHALDHAPLRFSGRTHRSAPTGDDILKLLIIHYSLFILNFKF